MAYILHIQLIIYISCMLFPSAFESSIHYENQFCSLLDLFQGNFIAFGRTILVSTTVTALSSKMRSCTKLAHTDAYNI